VINERVNHLFEREQIQGSANMAFSLVERNGE